MYINDICIYSYKELVADGTMSSPLITLADKLRMPAMLVSKLVLTDQIKEEKLKKKLDRQHSINDNSLNSSILNDVSVRSTATNLQNDSDMNLKPDLSVNDSKTKESDTSYSIDEQLSKQLNWLTCRLRSMYKYELSSNKSDNSLNLTPHQLAMSTWLIRKDPQLAYEVYKSSVVDGHYGSCVEYIKRCNLLIYLDIN